jgi:hypothetical protein
MGLLRLPTTGTTALHHSKIYAHDRLVYGFESPARNCIYTALGQWSPPPKCRYWTFLDADSGRLIDGPQQLIVGPVPIPTSNAFGTLPPIPTVPAAQPHPGERCNVTLSTVGNSTGVTRSVAALAKVEHGKLDPAQQSAAFPTCQAANRFAAIVTDLTSVRVLAVVPIPSQGQSP